MASATLLLAAGCSNNSSAKSTSSSNDGTYDTALSNGKSAISDSNYEQAQAYYKMATTIKTNDAKAAAYYKQAQALADAQTNIDDLDFDKALDQLKVVTTTPNGLTAMNNKAKTIKQSVKKIIKNRKALNKLYNTAKQQNADKNYAQADAILSQLLSQDKIGQDAYVDIRLEALSLKADNSAAAAESGQTTTDVPTTDSSSSSSNNAATSSSDAPAEEQSKAASGGEYTQDQDTTVNGKAVTAAQITKARSQLKDQGVDTSAWSDLDIIHAIQNAAADGRSTVKESDMSNYK